MRAFRQSLRQKTSGSFGSLLTLVFSCAILSSGCSPRPSWTAEVTSPDGRALASARTLDQGGFAIASAWPETIVYLRWNSGSRPSEKIISLVDGPDNPNPAKVVMTWISPNHLEVGYFGPRTIEFQAVKYGTVDITLRDINAKQN